MKPRRSASESEAPDQGGNIHKLRRLPGYAALSWLRQVIVDRNFRETARLRASPPPGLFQPTGHTKLDRHPALFSFARESVGDGPDRQLLSFGCSTGEEVFSLRRYFAESRITGIDISPRRIRECRRRARRLGADPALRFAVASSAEKFAPQSIDAIFANSVLRHGDLALAPPRCDHRISFADFERIVSGLAHCIKPGGLLVLRYANFRFADTAAASNFAPILRMPRDRATPIYDSVNRLAPQEPEETVVFRRLG
ncbi:MAG: methyltransferase domain-containing protein [Sphingomonas sp.]|uniref:methyltransferase domain-containing protein n=1 Tax=Sphingomonas sp. TaxID=28214 RepID=UPI0035639849